MVEGHPSVSLARVLRQRGQACELTLAPFAGDELGAYLERPFASRAIAEQLTQLIEEQSGGNPIFVSAPVSHLIARDRIRRRGSVWEFHGDANLADVGLPADLRDAIERQRSNVPATARAVLDAASVDGVEFAVDPVAATLDAAPDKVEDVCHELAHAGRIASVSDSRAKRGGARPCDTASPTRCTGACSTIGWRRRGGARDERHPFEGARQLAELGNLREAPAPRCRGRRPTSGGRRAF